MKFQSGEILFTRSIYAACQDDKEFNNFIHQSLARHLNGDWGDCCNDDKTINERALEGGCRLFSSYLLSNQHMDRDKIYIITEWDRSATTILFPDEY